MFFFLFIHIIRRLFSLEESFFWLFLFVIVVKIIILKEIGKGRLLPLAAEDLPKYIRKKDAQ